MIQLTSQAYISGKTVIILRNPKEIIQTITVSHVENLSAINIEESSGRIAICNEECILIFDPIGRDEGDLRWTQTQDISIPVAGRICSLSWGTSEELLVGGTQLWLYYIPRSEEPRLIWQQHLANEVAMAYFSNDAEVIASCGQHDRLVKIWRRLSFELESTRFDVSYLPHPAAVTDLHWRKPWHKEQSLDDLLYTFCSDNQIRVWSYSDPHSLSVVQLIATIDANASIVPRRTSFSSISQKRYVFILDSRDFSHATERAIQESKSQSIDHALEHLIEIANRSPEFCVIFDGLGHMSVWGLENAGCKTKRPTAVFNITLVDEVDIHLGSDLGKEDCVRLSTFGGGTSEASLSVLVHTFAGQIDWYESPITHFFDTASRQDRVKLLSSWSGHDLAVDHIARGSSDKHILSWTEEGQAILWVQNRLGALRRKCNFHTGRRVLGVVYLDSLGHSLILNSDAISLWDVSQGRGVRVALESLKGADKPTSIAMTSSTLDGSNRLFFVLNTHSGTQELWQVDLTKSDSMSDNCNDDRSVLTKLFELEDLHIEPTEFIACDSIPAFRDRIVQPIHTTKVCVNSHGCIRRFEMIIDTTSSKVRQNMISEIHTNIRNPGLARASSSGKCALTTQDRRCLTIWDLDQGVCEWQYVHRGTGEIEKIAWTSTRRGNHALFLGFAHHALFVGQFRYSAISARQDAWYITQNVSLRDFTTIHIGDVCWLSGEDIAIATGNQIFVLENVLTEHDSPILKRSQQLVNSKSATAVIDMACSTLPVFRADFLETLLIERGPTPVSRVLWRLYDQLKFFTEGDELASDLGLNSLFTEGLGSLSNAVQTDGDLHNDLLELETVEASFKEYLDSVDIWQLGPNRQRNLSDFLSNFIQVSRHHKSLDENALRYLYALYRTPADQDLGWPAFCFASRSLSQEALADLIMQHHDGKLTWAAARRTGLFVWLNDLSALQIQFENVARAEYNKYDDRNPVNCSLYYLALNKKSVLQSLWRMTYGMREKENTMKLLANNFDDTRWKNTALKNAYALLSKRRFEYAAAFFLLGGGLKDAVNVCINQLQDIQLAIAVARVWDKDVQQSKQVFRELVEKDILRRAVDDEQGRWMAAWAYAALDDPAKALQALVRPLTLVITANIEDHEGPLKSMSFRANDPRLNILYIQLRQQLVKKQEWLAGVIGEREEWDFVLRNAKWLVRAGMDSLALGLLKEWKFIARQIPKSTTTLTMSAAAPAERISGLGTSHDAHPANEQKEVKKKPPPTQFFEPSADSLLDSFGF